MSNPQTTPIIYKKKELFAKKTSGHLRLQNNKLYLNRSPDDLYSIEVFYLPETTEFNYHDEYSKISIKNYELYFDDDYDLWKGEISRCLLNPSEKIKSIQETLLVCSYNLNYGLCSKSIRRAIMDCHADVVCMQETNPRWEAYLHQEVRTVYPFRRYVHREDHRFPAGGIAILSKYPFEDELIESPLGNWFPAHLYRVETPLGIVQILNLHLRPPLHDKFALPISPVSYFTSIGDRLTECQYYSELLDQDLPTV
eukprot:TRINITY_DN6337_c0_g1_i2.p1 TRINITY_DN6337_c0_g1~~TRINITY_DN6337_c0_g1_i2.p1  ORF type:complete len:264 (-),score=41.66 TRINITY_DN6337_c0_g1_i2:307-1068(-)